MRQIVIVEGGGWGDVVTNHAAYFIHRDITSLALSKGWKQEEGAEKRLVVLAGPNANRALFEKALGIDQFTVWVDGCGHGNETVFFCGYNCLPLMDRTNEQLARGKVFTIRSCSGGRDFQRRLDMDEIGEGSYTDTLWICISNQGEPEKDPDSAQFHRCFDAQSIALLNGKSFRDSGTDGIEAYHKEATAPGTPPVNRYYLEIDGAVYQHKVKALEGWDWKVEQPPQDKILFYVDEVLTHEWVYVGPGSYVWRISIVEEGRHTLKVVDPKGNSAYVRVNIAKDEQGISFLKPKDNETFQAGATIEVEVRCT